MINCLSQFPKIWELLLSINAAREVNSRLRLEGRIAILPSNNSPSRNVFPFIINGNCYKQSLADIRVAHDFFVTHLPADLLQKIDLSTLKLQKQSFIAEAYRTTEADVVYQVTVGNALAYLYILCEHQSDIDERIAFRLLIYQVRIMEMHLRQHPKSPLPIVYPLVVYTGEKAWNAPLEIFDLFAEQKALAKQYCFQPYQLIEVQRLSDEELKRHRWSGLVEFVLKYRRIRNFESYLETLLPWLDKIEIESGSYYVKVVLEYVINNLEADEEVLFLEKSNQYLSATLRGEVMTLAQRFEEKGMQQGECSLLLRQLERKFKTVPEVHRQRLAQASAETLLIWGERVLVADTLDEIFE